MKNFLMLFRKLKKNKTATSLGIAGLVVGMVCVVYIFLLVIDEISFDRFNTGINRIFVVHAYLEGRPEKVDFDGCPPAVATALKDEYPEVEKTCRYIPPYFQYLITSGENKFTERTAMADFSFFDIFSAFAIVVLCLGLLGMVMFLIEQKTKEIGVRKCLGENVLSITGQLIKPFLVSGTIAGVIAIPLTWYVMKHWLQNYAYHIHLNLWIFILSGIITIGMALFTVLWQSWRAAIRNPVEALRYE